MKLSDFSGDTLEIQPPDYGGEHALDVTVTEDGTPATFRLMPLNALGLGATLLAWGLWRLLKEGV